MQPENPLPQPSRGPTGVVPSGTPEQNPNVITPQISPGPPPSPPSPPIGQTGPASFAPPPPQVPPSSPGPVIGQPGPVPVTGQMPPLQPPMPQAVPPAMSSASGKGRQLLIAFACLVVVVIISFVLFKVLFNHPITREQVNSAMTTASNFDNDVFEAASDINKSQNAASAGEVRSAVDEANGKLDDAEKEFATLKKSNVLSDDGVSGTFKTLDGKWGPYLAYLRGSASDYKDIIPVFIDFTARVDKLNKADVGTRGQLSSYLNQFKDIIDTTSKELDGIKPVLPEDKDLLDAFKEDLDSSSSVAAKAGKDLSAGKQAYVVENDLLGIFDVQDKFYDRIDKISARLDDKEKKLKPDKAYDAFTDSLDKLLDKVDK